jgi:hypothetical protein
VGGQHRPDDLGAGGGRPLPGDDCPELLEHELRGEVVADDVHVAQDLGERRRRAHGERPAAAVGALRRPVDPNAGTGERCSEEGRCSQRAVHSRDGECRERLRLERDESGLPPGSGSPRVEPRLVGDEAAGHAAHTGRANVTGESGETGTVEGRVAAAPQYQVAGPDAGRAEQTLAQHGGLHPERGAERLERRVRDDELLVRGGEEGFLRPVCIHDSARGEIDGERGRPWAREPGESAVQAGAERGGAGRLGQDSRREGCGEGGTDHDPGTHRQER